MLYKTIIFAMFVFAVGLVTSYLMNSDTEVLRKQITVLEQSLSSYKEENANMKARLNAYDSEYNDMMQKLNAAIAKLTERVPSTNRSAERSFKARVTMYDACKACCGKTDGVTASGAIVKDNYTVAAGKSIPFGTQVYIPYFKDWANGGVFTVQDRGGAIKDNCIDVYNSKAHEIDFGVQYLEVYIIKGED